MGPITYSLCQKALIGPALWIAGLCAFPPLIENTSLPLTTAGATVSAPFTVPVDLRYQFVLQFEFPSTEARLQDTLVGSRYQTECETDPAALADKPEFGRPIPLRLIIRNAKDHSLVTDEQVTSLCVLGHAGNKKSRAVAWVTLSRGDYTAEISNLSAQTGLDDVNTFIALVPGSSK